MYERVEKNLNIPWDFVERNNRNIDNAGNIKNNGTAIKVTYVI